jgi:hypothetical protein
LIIILAEYRYARRIKYLNVNEAFLKLYGLSKESNWKTGVELVTEIDNNTINKIALNNTFVNDFEIKTNAKLEEFQILNIEIDNTPCIIVG